MPMDQYLWIAVCGGILGFAYGFFIGANDVANAFAPSVAAKSVTLKQAVLIAAVFEFSGAFFLGASVTSTIRSKIVDTDLYEDEPEVLMFGMFTALLGANIMLFIATHLGMPVSTTHDIVGSIMGFSIAAKGFGSIHWDVAGKIFMSWAISPLLSGTVSSILFFLLRKFVLHSEHAFERANLTFPIVLTLGIGLDLFYVLFKGSSNYKDFHDGLKWYVVLPISLAVGFGCGMIWHFFLGPIAKKRVMARRLEQENVAATAHNNISAALEKADSQDQIEEIDVDTYMENYQKKKLLKEDDSEEEYHTDTKETKTVATPSTIYKEPVPTATEAIAYDEDIVKHAYKKFAQNTFDQDLHAQSMVESARAAEIWEDAEKFDPDAEGLFNYLQVFTACLNSFAHGANDVSNTIAPLSAIIQIYRDGTVESKAQVQKWILAYGGFAIVLGLLLYGYRVMKSLGFKLTRMSASRGFIAELSASLVVVTASFNEIPVSSTQCIVGAVTGVGLVGGTKNIDWWFLLRVCLGWVILFFFATTCSGLIFAFGYYSPSEALDIISNATVPEL